MIMGGVYLTYSAYFLSLDFKTIFLIMNILILLVYLALAFTYYRNCRLNMDSIKTHLDEMAGEQEGVGLQASLLIKYNMLK